MDNLNKKYIVRGFYMHRVEHICNNSKMLNMSDDIKYFDTKEEAERALPDIPSYAGYVEIIEVYI